MKNTNRRNFIKNSTVAGLGIGIGATTFNLQPDFKNYKKGKRIGLIGLDTGHSVAFTKSINDPLAGDKYNGYKVVAAYPKGTDKIEEWRDRIPEITSEVKSLGVEIVDSIEELLDKVDAVLLTCVDGNKHLEQAIPVFKAGKPVYINKPIAASLKEAYAIAREAKKHNAKMFSSSALRFLGGIKEITEGEIGRVTGADAYSPAPIEKNHPDLYWYGVHGVEILYSVMGRGCKSVQRTFTEDTELVIGIWEDQRIGTYRGIRNGHEDYGGTVFGEKAIKKLPDYTGYDAMLVGITEFFRTGIVPVPVEETLEIFAFLEAAEESKKRGGAVVEIKSVTEGLRI
ncbi:MAG: Gfo/Idh/MocA family oxidoreductase [Prolixibacteraceae bacterium]|jgi:predicted dehydrogenase|nr:Gfo/Idh/MocA family oxidoreductase [Prolixibacteraceae bacterium]NLO00919.1 Gfo/Idh/MocA family oxidoreductase [Bacteroidales bacterium]